MIRCGGSRPSFSPRVARVLRARFRRRGARRRAPRLRRSSRAALPALARRHARAGAVGLESGLVGGLSRATVLPARRRLRGSAPSPGVLHDALGAGVVPLARLDRLPGAGADRVPGARSNSRKRLARPAGRLPRAHGVRRRGERGRGRRAHRHGGGPAARVGARLPWAMLVVTLLDRVALEPLGARFLPANRVADGALIALILAAALGWSGLRRASSNGTPRREILLSLAGVLLLVVVGLRSGALSLWPRAADWPSLSVVERGLRLGDLWAALREGPPGRVLFVRAGVPLVYGPPWGAAWYPPHPHVTALAPLFAGPAIRGGTFTHPSPIAALIYRGDAGPAPIRRLAEQLDGVSLFGRALESVDAETFNGYATALGVGVVVALDEDASRLRALDDNRDFTRRPAPSPFLIFSRRDGVELPRAIDGGRWTITLAATRDAWTSARTTYYPLWHASAQGVPLPTRRGRLGDLEVRLSGDGPRAVDLAYRPGVAEISGIIISVLGGVVSLAACRRRTA